MEGKLPSEDDHHRVDGQNYSLSIFIIPALWSVPPPLFFGGVGCW